MLAAGCRELRHAYGTMWKAMIMPATVERNASIGQTVVKPPLSWK